jgi:hypothetical protein
MNNRHEGAGDPNEHGAFSAVLFELDAVRHYQEKISNDVASLVETAEATAAGVEAILSAAATTAAAAASTSGKLDLLTFRLKDTDAQ